MGRTASWSDSIGYRIDQSTDTFWGEPIKIGSLRNFQFCLSPDGQPTDPVNHYHHQLRFCWNHKGLKNFFLGHLLCVLLKEEISFYVIKVQRLSFPCKRESRLVPVKTGNQYLKKPWIPRIKCGASSAFAGMTKGSKISYSFVLDFACLPCLPQAGILKFGFILSHGIYHGKQIQKALFSSEQFLLWLDIREESWPPLLRSEASLKSPLPFYDRTIRSPPCPNPENGRSSRASAWRCPYQTSANPLLW